MRHTPGSVIPLRREVFRSAGRWLVALGAAAFVTQALGQINVGVGLGGEATSSDALRFADPAVDDELFEIDLAGHWGLINQSGRIVALPVFDWTEFGVDGLARAVQGD
ncbi:MAG: WG repeat-containing protein, partial [Planctomycetota bacterium]